jgi:Monooxygenase af470-like
MIQVHQVAIAKPLTVGAGAVLCTIFIHGLALGATVNFFRRETRLGRAGMRYLIDLTIVVLVMSFNQRVGEDGTVGIWHETYQVAAGQYECVYNNMPRFGLAIAGTHEPAIGHLREARSRMQP